MHSSRVNVQVGAVREARRLARLTREQLAGICGLSCTTLYLAERGLASSKTIAAIADAIANYVVATEEAAHG